MIARRIPSPQGRTKVFSNGSSFGKSRSASSLLTTVTGRESGPSVLSNPRPATIGIRIVRKKPSVTRRRVAGRKSEALCGERSPR
jgi:hypothetical protein